MTPERRTEIERLASVECLIVQSALRDCLREIDAVRKETAREIWDHAEMYGDDSRYSVDAQWIEKRFGPFGPEQDQGEGAALGDAASAGRELAVVAQCDSEPRPCAEAQPSSHPSAAAQVLTHNGVGNSGRPASAADQLCKWLRETPNGCGYSYQKDAADLIERLSARVADLESQVGEGKDWGKRGQLLDAAEKRVAELERQYRETQQSLVSMHERAEAAEQRYRWLADKTIACDYGDNDSIPNQVGYHIRHNKGPSHILGPSIDAAIDGAIAKERT